jgi:exopolysaccharide biosynthesis protein
MENIFVEFLPPWIETGLQPAFYDKESGTVLQQTARMYARVNMLIRMFNKLSKNTKTTVEEYINKFNELHDYVQDYFDNLDVQEEINNKLDEMVDDGTLQGFFAGYGLEIGEDNKVKVKAGSGITVDENGVSESPFDDYIDIEEKTVSYTNDAGCSTTIYYSIIPATYKPKIICSDDNDPNVLKRASVIDYEHKPTLMVNLGPWKTSAPIATYGPLIVNNDIKVENNLTGGTDWYRTIMGIDDAGVMSSINGTASAESVDKKYAVRCWYTLVNNGITNPNITNADPREPRTIIGQDYDGNYLVFVSGGRQTYWDTGMNFTDVVDFVQNRLNWNAKTLFSVDGGSSSNLLFHGIRQNPLIKGVDRACPNWLVWSSDTAKNEGLFRSQSVNNERMIDEEIEYIEGHMIDWQHCVNYFQGEKTVLNAGTRVFFSASRLVTYNLNFTVTEDTNDKTLILLDNLPYTNANYYFIGLEHSGWTNVVFKLEKDDARQCSVLRLQSNNTTLYAGTSYSINATVWCERQY